MKKISLVLLCVFLCCLALSLTACASSRTQYCYDEMGLFGEEQIQAINQKGIEVQSEYNVEVLVATCQRVGSSAMQTGDSFRSAHNLSGNMIVIIVNAKGVGSDYHFDVYTYGVAYTKVTDSEINDILFSSAGNKILTSDSAVAAQGLVSMMGMCGSAYRPKWGKIVVFAFVVAIIVAIVCVLAVKRAYSRKRKNITYPLDKYCRLNLKDRNDTFTHSVTTFVVINSNSSSGGGHSSGGGGGGGHRGGR